jgi:hypothetical protein
MKKEIIAAFDSASEASDEKYFTNDIVAHKMAVKPQCRYFAIEN